MGTDTLEQSKEFFRILFCPKGMDVEGYISMFFLKRPSTATTEQFSCTDYKKALQVATEYAKQGYDAYFSPAILREPVEHGRGKKADFIGARTLWVDLDTEYKDVPEGVPEPSAIVSSGHGFHIYWFLNRLVKGHDKIEKRNLWLANQFGADHCHSIDHLLRVPGTMNFKQHAA